MRRSTARWTTAMAAAALMALPATSWAQTTDPHRPATSATPGAQTQEQTPQQHLREAQQAVRSIDKTELTGEAKMRVEELKQHLDRLEAAAAPDPTTPGVQAEERDVPWETEVAAIDRILTQMLGPEDTTGVTGTTGTGAVGTAGTAGEVTVDPTTRNRLEEVRRHVKAFAEAKESKGSDPAATMTPDPTGTTTPATGEPPATRPATEEPEATQPQTGMQQADQDAARRHLTDARNTLSELTQLPAAAQLTGEQRTQISQLISNFNDLITTQADWRASYAKLEANLDALIGPRAAGAPTPPPTTEPPAGTGAVGTTGTEGTLDPEISAKLNEFRTHLEKFEEAAGGPAPGDAPGHMPHQGQPTTAQPTSQHDAHQQETQQPRMTEEKRQQILQHIQAIEAILERQSGAAGTTGVPPTGTPPTTGTPPAGTPPTGVPPTGVPPTAGTAGMTPSAIVLAQNDVQQLRRHLSELRRLIEADHRPDAGR